MICGPCCWPLGPVVPRFTAHSGQRPFHKLLDRAKRTPFRRITEGDRNAAASGTRRASDAVYVIIGMMWNVKIEDVAHVGNIKPARGNVGGNQQWALAASELGKGCRARRLVHVTVERYGAKAMAKQRTVNDGNIVVFDTQQKKVVGILNIPQVAGIVFAPDLHKFYAADSNDSIIYAIQEKTLRYTPIKLQDNDGPDGLAYDQNDHLILISNPGNPPSPDSARRETFHHLIDRAVAGLPGRSNPPSPWGKLFPNGH